MLWHDHSLHKGKQQLAKESVPRNVITFWVWVQSSYLATKWHRVYLNTVCSHSYKTSSTMFSGIATQSLFHPPYLITISGSGQQSRLLPYPAELSGSPGPATVHYKKRRRKLKIRLQIFFKQKRLVHSQMRNHKTVQNTDPDPTRP